MSNIAKLKRQAAEFEQRREFDKALAKYVQLLQEMEENPEETDVALYNRVGDLLLRQGRVAEAVQHYEKAVDLYAEAGFFNNAIALCNKILRSTPGRSAVYYKLGKISARKGFVTDAKQNFLEYAERMQHAGQLDEALRALKEFADLCPEEDDIRLMLADQLARRNRKSEAIEQLQTLYEKLQAEGRAKEARATITRMQAIDPALAPPGPGWPTPSASELVFLDVHAEPAGPRGTPPASATPAERSTPAPVPAVLDAPDVADPWRASEAPVVAAESTSRTSAEPWSGETDAAALDVAGIGLESAFVATAEDTVVAPMPDLEPAMPAGASATPAREWSLDGTSGAEGDAETDLPLLDVRGYQGVSLILPDPPAAPAVDTGEGVAEGAPLLGLPLLADLMPAGADAPPHRSGAAPEAPTPGALREAVAREPENWPLRRRLAELLLEEGAREEGLEQLEAVIMGLEQAGDLTAARSLADELVRLRPDSVAVHQKRVEYAFRAGDHPNLVQAYLELADCLVCTGQLDRARSVFARVIELAPADMRARAGLETIGRASPEGGYATPPSAPAAAAPAAPPRDSGFVYLEDWLLEDEKPKSTRMVAEGITDPEVEEQVDFAEMLERFKQGIAANVDDTDHQSHYDLGIAYREMGLVDEAIAEFQKALRASGSRVRTYEALGQCFVDKRQYQIAVALLSRAAADRALGDDTLVGVLYLLGRACEELRRWEDARAYYERVFAIDVQFRDVAERLVAVEAVGA